MGTQLGKSPPRGLLHTASRVQSLLPGWPGRSHSETHTLICQPQPGAPEGSMHLSTSVCSSPPRPPNPQELIRGLVLGAVSRTAGLVPNWLPHYSSTPQLRHPEALPQDLGPAPTTLSPLGHTESHSLWGQPRPEVLQELREVGLVLFMFKEITLRGVDICHEPRKVKREGTLQATGQPEYRPSAMKR